MGRTDARYGSDVDETRLVVNKLAFFPIQWGEVAVIYVSVVFVITRFRFPPTTGGLRV
jgi:hypothetical protein